MFATRLVGRHRIGGACRVLLAALLAAPFAARPVVSQEGPVVDVCPALELLGVVHLLAGSRFATELDDPFVDEAKRRFEPWARHPAVAGATSVFSNGVRLDDLVAVLASASAPPELAIAEALQPDLTPPADSVLRAYLADLRDFATSSRADEFFAQTAPLREAVLLRERGPFSEKMAGVAAYLGSPLRVNVCLNPFFAAGHITWNPAGDTESGRSMVMLGPRDADGGVPRFDLAERLDAELLASLIGPFVASLAAASEETVASYEALFDPIAYPLSRRGITQWQDAWVEHVVRAVALRLAASDGGGVAEEKVGELRRAGFFYLDPLLRRLEAYEADRGRFPDLGTFYPVLVETLERESVLARSVVIDPRIELMTGVQILAGWWLLTSFDFPYRRDLTEYLAAASDHPAIDTYRRLLGEGFRFEVVPRFFVLMSPPPELELAGPVPDEIAGRAGGAALLDEFAERLRAFAHETGFDGFLRSHSGTYHAIEVRNRRAVATAVDSLWRYLGDAPAEWRVVLSPLMHNGGFAGHGEGSIPVAFVGPAGTADGLPDFGGPERLGPLVWHEFSHTVVNPLAERYADRVSELEFAFEPIRAAMDRQFYGSWSTALNEHIVRAIEARLMARVIGTDEATEMVSDYESLGFRYLPDLVDELNRYEAARTEYPTLADFYPRLLDRLEESATSLTSDAGR